MTGDAVPPEASQAEPAYWTRLKLLFHGAIEQPAATRLEWLAHAAAGDATLRAHVERLLLSYEGIGDFLEEPATVDLAELLAAESPAPEPDDARGKRQDGHAGATDTHGGDEPRWQPGDRVGHYTILEPLGHGGMGVVHLAQDERLGRRVALKALPFAIARRPDLRERLRREARAAATIAHPAVATVYALEEIDDHLFLASEYVRGRSLRRLIDEGPVALPLALRIATSVAGGLAAAHAAGIIHRDLKPENIVVGEDGVAKIVDFGIAFIERDDGPRLTGSRHAVGTPAYMAPEQLLGLPVDARTDIYAFGVVLEEMLLGRHPLATAASRGTGRDAARSEAGAAARPGTGAATLAALAARCAQPAPEARYASARALLADLSRTSVEPDAFATPNTPAPLAPVDERPHATKRADVPSAAARPRWWWEFHQSAVALAYSAILLPLWVARGQIGGLPGRAIFAIGTGAVIVAAFIRCHLWFTSRFYPQELTWVRARVGGWIRTADWTFVAALGLGAVLLRERSAIDFVLLACAIGAAVAFLVIEPVTARAAFGDGPAGHSAE
jgi:serine/threonine protein kinase